MASNGDIGVLCASTSANKPVKLNIGDDTQVKLTNAKTKNRKDVSAISVVIAILSPLVENRQKKSNMERQSYYECYWTLTHLET